MLNIRRFQHRSTVTIRNGATSPMGDQFKTNTRAIVDLNGEKESTTLWVPVIPISGPLMGTPVYIHHTDLRY